MTDNEKRLQEQVDTLKIEIIRLSAQVEAYRNAQGQVVNLAFSLIASSAIAIVIARAFK